LLITSLKEEDRKGKVSLGLFYEWLAVRILPVYCGELSLLRFEGFGFRLLIHPWVVRIGILSYSIYLWQQLFLNPADVHRFWWQTFPANLPLCFVAAGLSYYLLERPFLRLTERLREGAGETSNFKLQTSGKLQTPSFKGAESVSVVSS